MKTKLLALLLGTALVGSSTAVLAGPGKGRGDDQPRTEQRQQRHLSDNYGHKDRIDAGSMHRTGGDRYHPRWGKPGRHHAKRGHRGHHWSAQEHDRHHHGRPAPYAHYHGHDRHYDRHEPHNQLSIILHGHF